MEANHSSVETPGHAQEMQKSELKEVLKKLKHPAGLEATIYFEGFEKLLDFKFTELFVGIDTDDLLQRMKIWKDNLWKRCKNNSDGLTSPKYVDDELVRLRMDRINLTGPEKVEAMDVVEELVRRLKKLNF